MERQPKTVVFVTAHADDLAHGAGGTCALLAAKGYDVRVIVLADDQAPTSGLESSRRKEAEAGAAELGVKPGNVHLLGLAGDIKLDRVTVTALRALIEALAIEPLAVFTHSEADSDQDHVAASRLARTVFRNTTLFKFAIGTSTIPSAFEPSVYCIIDRVLERKERALLFHWSQYEAERIPMQRVRQFSAHYAAGRGGRYCEPFELDIQNDARDVRSLLALVDSSPFTQFWSPLLASAKLHVFTSDGETKWAAGAMSDAVFLTRLQSRLISNAQSRLGADPSSRFEVHQAKGVADTTIAETGNVLVLGGAPVNAAADVMLDWIGLRPYLRDLNFVRRRTQGRGLLTIAANAAAVRKGNRAFVVAATGVDQACTMAAAQCVLEESKLARILPEAREVFEGRLAIIQIEVSLDPDAQRPSTGSGRRRSSGRAAA